MCRRLLSRQGYAIYTSTVFSAAHLLQVEVDVNYIEHLDRIPALMKISSSAPPYVDLQVIEIFPDRRRG